MPISDHDLVYTCPTCSWVSTDTQHLDSRTWLCSTCQHPVHVRMRDSRGRSCIVQRVQAQQVKEGDELFYDGGNGLAPARVRASSKATGQGNAGLWSLALSGPYALTVDPRRYFNRILPA